jgi:hypothetical protein
VFLRQALSPVVFHQRVDTGHNGNILEKGKILENEKILEKGKILEP